MLILDCPLSVVYLVVLQTAVLAGMSRLCLFGSVVWVSSWHSVDQAECV